MKSVNLYVSEKMKFRKTLMIIFSFCSILLICGIFSAAQEASDEEGLSSVKTKISSTESENAKESETLKQSPREIIMEKRDKKVRLYTALVLFVIMSVSFITDIVFIRCPVCSGHIQYAVNPERCSQCGVSFLRKESEK